MLLYYNNVPNIREMHGYTFDRSNDWSNEVPDNLVIDMLTQPADHMMVHADDPLCVFVGGKVGAAAALALAGVFNVKQFKAWKDVDDLARQTGLEAVDLENWQKAAPAQAAQDDKTSKKG